MCHCGVCRGRYHLYLIRERQLYLLDHVGVVSLTLRFPENQGQFIECMCVCVRQTNSCCCSVLCVMSCNVCGFVSACVCEVDGKAVTGSSPRKL